MNKLKQGKLTRITYWIALFIIWGTMAALMMVGNASEGPISKIRLFFLLVMFVCYIAALVMRLRDVGQSMGFAVICVLVPIFVFVIGFWPSLEMQMPVGKKNGGGNTRG